jgi:hypothetical protein
MNDLSHPPKIQAHPAVTWVLLGLMVMFALNSYPMLHDGYDWAYHLKTIVDRNYHPNNFWHFQWAHVFSTLNIEDNNKIRALIIHRTQTALTLLMLVGSAYMFLSTALKHVSRQTLWQLAMVASVVWMVTHGTYSSPAGEPHYSARHVLSWLQWYSVTYQIALPMFFIASAAILKAVTAKVPSQTVWWSVITLITAYLIARIHAAELVYFLFTAGGIVLIYVVPGKSWRVLFMVTMALAVVLMLGLTFTYRQPEIISLLHPSRWGELVARMNEFGHLLVGSNINRSETTWHSLSSVSLLAAVASVFMAKDKDALRLALLVVYSSALAIGIQIHHSAGLLGLVIGEYVTWRFGFSTLLYLGIPLLVGLWLQQRPNTGSAWRNSAALFGASGGILLLVLVYSRLFEPLHPAWNFAKSLLLSLHPVLGHFQNTP